MRLALLAAFPFPAPRGSQLFARDQARALEDAGADVTLFCYGSGDGRPVARLRVERAPRAISPRALHAGPSPLRPLADAALLARFVAAQRREPFHAVLGHNAEGAALALAARSRTRVPVVYVAHTLWDRELPSYLPAALAPLAHRLGRRIDAGLARAADGVLALSERGRQALAASARGPVACVPPGHAGTAAPGPAAVHAACARVGLRPGGYVVYAGNLDRYQDLARLDAAAARIQRVPVALVTHDRGGPPLPHLRRVVVERPEEARALVHGARVAVLPRRHAGGFPLKLLHYMEAALPIVAVRPLADTLEHGRSGWLLAESARPDELASALAACFDDAALRARLGAGARASLARRHAWPPLARATLALLDRVCGASRSRAAA